MTSQTLVFSDDAVRRAPGYASRRIILSVPGRELWQRPPSVVYLEREFNRLVGLQLGWDGALARIVSDVAVATAVRTLAPLVDDRTLLPQLFPLADGGLQVEWHAGGNSIELEVECDGSLFVFAGGNTEEPSLEGVPGEDLPHNWQMLLRAFLRRMSEQVQSPIWRS